MQEYKKKIRMVALDIDGTTFNSKNELTDRTRATLERAAEAGVHIVVSTGRSFNSLPAQIKEVKGISYAITSNGAHINEISSGKAIYNDYIHPDNIDRIIELKEKYNAGLEVFIDGQAYIDEATYRDIEKNGCEYRRAEYVLWSRKPVEDINKLARDNRTKIENVNFCFATAELADAAKPEISMMPDATITTSFRNNLEVGGANTSKKTALIELMNRLNVSRENLMCCGDAPNDIQMIELAGIGVAMGNAWGGTKDHADYVTASNDEDGVALAVEKFVLGDCE